LKSKRSITLLASSQEAKDEWLTAITSEIKEATDQEHAQDKRMTTAVKDKVADNLQKLEQVYHTGVSSPEGSPGFRGSFGSDSMGSPMLGNSTDSATSSDGDGASGPGRRMSVREKRMQLMHSARRSGSLPSSPVINTSTGE